MADAGNLPGAVFAADRSGAGARNLAAVTKMAAAVADAVADVAASGRLPLLLGGDCTITIGAVAGLRRQHPDGGLVYLDGDADLGVPGDGGSGILDSMGISHLLGRGAPELAGLGGQLPLLEPARLAILGADPRETSDAGRAFLAGRGVSFQEAPAFIADPAGAAERALAAVTRGAGGSSSTSTWTSSTPATFPSATSRITDPASGSITSSPACASCAPTRHSPGSC